MLETGKGGTCKPSSTVAWHSKILLEENIQQHKSNAQNVQIFKRLAITSEFNEVFSPPKSEPRKMRQPAFFRVVRILRDEKKFGRNGAKLRSGERSVVVKFRCYS